MRKHLLRALLVTAGAALMLGFVPRAGAGDPGLSMVFESTSVQLIDGIYADVQLSATCDAAYGPSLYYGGMYLYISQGPADAPTGLAHGDGGPLICDGQPHTYTSRLTPLLLSSPYLPLRPGPAELWGMVYLWTNTGENLAADPVQADVFIHGAPHVKAPPSSELGLTLGPATVDQTGAVSTTFEATCSNPAYEGDIIGASAELSQASHDGIATAYTMGPGDQLACDGSPHRYSLGTTQPNDPAVPFKAGPALASVYVAVLDEFYNPVSVTTFDSTAKLTGSAPVRAPGPGPLSPELELGSGRLGDGGTMTVDFAMTCDASSGLAYVGAYVMLREKTQAGVATGIAGDAQPLVCDGSAHTYSVGTAYPDDPEIPFKPGLAWVGLVVTTWDADWNMIGGTGYPATITVRG